MQAHSRPVAFQSPVTVTSVDHQLCALPPLSVGAGVGQGGPTTPVESLAPLEPSGLVASGWESEGGACSASVAPVSAGGGACAVPSSTAAAAGPTSQSRPRGRGGHVAARCSKRNCVLACGDSGHVATGHEWRHVVCPKDPNGENYEEPFKKDLTRLWRPVQTSRCGLPSGGPRVLSVVCAGHTRAGPLWSVQPGVWVVS